MGIKIGSTTGYNQQMANLVNDAAKEQGLVVDALVNVSDTNDIGRPYPYMIFKCMEELEIVSVDQVMKVGDTTVDIEEGINAGIYSVGLIEGSSQLGLDEDEVKALSASEKEERYPQVKEAYEKAGAHEVVTSLADIADLVERLNQQEK